MDGTWPADLTALATEVDRFLDDLGPELVPVDDPWLVGHDPAFAARLAERGWLGITWPREWGGGGRSQIERLVVMERLLERGAPVASAWICDRQIGPVLLEYGSREQCERWIPDMRAGRSAWCIGMSEPDAGSDVSAIATRADRDGDDFVVNGQKIWTSGARTADWCYLICRTDPHAPAHKGLSELVVDMRSPGVEVRPITDSSGDAHFNEVFFDEVRVPADHLVGDLNNSFGQTMRQLEHERGGIDRLISNRRLYLDVLRQADPSHPLVRQEVATIETGYRIGRLMVVRNVLGQGPPGFSAATKTFCTELEQRIASFAGAVMGAAAMVTGPVAGSQAGVGARTARNLVYAPAYTIMGGTTQILRNVLAERVLGLPREPRPPA
jgi:alkylation response protein AidB-like acyl-CoA dehydrogenase